MNLPRWLQFSSWLILAEKEPHEKFLDYQTKLFHWKNIFYLILVFLFILSIYTIDNVMLKMIVK